MLNVNVRLYFDNYYELHITLNSYFQEKINECLLNSHDRYYLRPLVILRLICILNVTVLF